MSRMLPGKKNDNDKGMSWAHFFQNSNDKPLANRFHLHRRTNQRQITGVSEALRMAAWRIKTTMH